MMPPSIPNKQVLNLVESTKISTLNTLCKDTSEKKEELITQSRPLPLTSDRLSSLQKTPIHLPLATRHALTHITQSLVGQQPLSQLLMQANRLGLLSSLTAESIKSLSLPQTEAYGSTSNTDENKTTQASNITRLMKQLFHDGLTLSADKNPDKSLLAGQLASAMRYYNLAMTPKTEASHWRQVIETLISSNSSLPKEEQALLELAQKWLTRSEHNTFMQQLHLSAGNALLLQDLPMLIHDQWTGIHLEVEQNPPQKSSPAEWKVVLQFALDEHTQVNAKLVLNDQQEIQVYLWTDNPDSTLALQQESQQLSRSLYDLGLIPQPIFITNGTPKLDKTTQAPSNLIGSVTLKT
jgi:ribosomal protein L17